MGKKSRWPSSRRSKFGAVKTAVDGVVFDSKLEAKVWTELRLREMAGEIVDLRRQVRYPLMVNGQKVCDVVADFEYRERLGRHCTSGCPCFPTVTADAKSAHTRKLPTFRLKAKLFKAIYGREILELGV